jgi:hypothetical protein
VGAPGPHMSGWLQHRPSASSSGCDHRTQVEHIPASNEQQTVTKAVLGTARAGLVIGPL